MKRLYLLLLILFVLHFLGHVAQGCPACWRGYGPGAERFNKPLADLRIAYEKQRRAALPVIREALRTSGDPLVQQRAAGYLADLGDNKSIPLLEDIVSELVKRVSFGTFGTESYEFQTRLKVAHALQKLGQNRLVSRIWERYDQLDMKKRMEVPYILNALDDPQLTEHLLEVLRKEDEHQVLLAALDVLGMSGDREALPFLRSKAAEWEKNYKEAAEPKNTNSPIYYLILRIKVEKAISKIEERN